MAKSYNYTRRQNGVTRLVLSGIICLTKSFKGECAHGGNFEMDITNFYSTYYQSFNSDYFIEKYNKKNKRGNC